MYAAYVAFQMNLILKNNKTTNKIFQQNKTKISLSYSYHPCFFFQFYMNLKSSKKINKVDMIPEINNKSSFYSHSSI